VKNWLNRAHPMDGEEALFILFLNLDYAEEDE